jgi:hypothetical protein
MAVDGLDDATDVDPSSVTEILVIVVSKLAGLRGSILARSTNFALDCVATRHLSSMKGSLMLRGGGADVTGNATSGAVAVIQGYIRRKM